MGNCLHRVDSSPIDENFSSIAFGDDFSDEWNNSYGEADYNYTGLEAAAPCRSCNLLDKSSLPFYSLTSVLGILASGAILFALLRPLFHWQLCPGRPILAQLAVGSILFSIAVPILAPGLSGVHNSHLCHVTHLVWYSSAFAQALLIGCRACLGPKLGAGQVPGLTLWLTLGLWVVAVLLGLPITLASDISSGLCTLTFRRGILQFMHTAACFAIFILLPLGLLGAKGLKKVLGKGSCPWVDILCVWFIFWWPHGVLRVLDSLVRSNFLTLSSCPAQQALDLLVHLAEALAILHCVATPLLLALFCHQATRTCLPSLPLPARQSFHLDTLGSKS
ncbi:atypical chemokine receptor 1 (Duffy blood group) [Rhinolophus ferrumequinum]|uniref:Atypical chemokine receptor 1 n=2 Tax=Rhinolophus ferrumequinum TaxID=59479 RepID=A0A671FXC3_RHIFE|nr:atypical chemokine receptor 1 (Duffy blood group) [Rhinolophus ferrumequinum]